MANEIEFEIVARLDKVEAALKSIEGTAQDASDKVQHSFDEMQSHALTSFKLIAIHAIEAGAAIIKNLVEGGLHKAIDAAIEQEHAINRLNQSLIMAGRFSEAASKDMQAFAEHIQETTTVQDEQALSLLAMAGNFTKTNEEAKKLTQAAIDLAAASGIDVNTALQQLGKTLSGLPIGKILPQIKNLSAEQLKLGGAIDFVLSRFGGAGAADLNTFGGAIQHIMNLFNSFMASLGNFIIRSPVIKNIMKFIGDQFIKLKEGLDNFAGGKDIVGSFVKDLISYGLALNRFVIMPLQLLWNVSRTIFSAVQTGIQEIVAIVATTVDGLLQIAGLFTNKFEGAQKSVHEFVDTSNQVLADFANKTKDNVNNLFDFNATTAIDDFINQLDDAANRANAPLDKLKGNVGAAMGQIKITTIATAQFFQQQLVSGISGAFQAVGVALAKGENAFKAFGKAVLSGMGDMAIKLGEMIITSAIAAQALKDTLLTFGGFGIAIAAGAALIAVGAALKTFAGGPAAASSGAASGGENFQGTGASEKDVRAKFASSGAQAQGISFEAFVAALSADNKKQNDDYLTGLGLLSQQIDDSTAALQQQQLQDQRPNLNVNIAGSVLGDKRTLGREIADAINEAFGADGLTIARGAIV